MVTISIGNRKIGDGQPCFIIAEAGVNHNGDLERAKKMIDVAAEARVDAVKFQAFTAEGLVTRTAPKAKYQSDNTGNAAESQFEMLKRLELTAEQHRLLKRYCEEKGLLYLVSPFDEASSDLLEELGVALYKIPSGEITHPVFLQHVARKKKPMIVSTGMSTLEEVHQAVRDITETGNRNLILLHCVSSYPTDPKEVNLRAMQTMQKHFDFPIGFSDHTLGWEIPLAAVALGACVVEKHFTLDRGLPGPDHAASMEPQELHAMVAAIRKVEAAFGSPEKRPADCEADTSAVARKSLVAAKNIPRGSVIEREWIAVKRPGTGLAPKLLPEIVGLKAKRDIPEGTVLALEMFSK